MEQCQYIAAKYALTSNFHGNLTSYCKTYVRSPLRDIELSQILQYKRRANIMAFYSSVYNIPPFEGTDINDRVAVTNTSLLRFLMAF